MQTPKRQGVLETETVARIQRAHEAGFQTVREHGEVPEPVDIAISVEAHRHFWRPRRTKLVLVAESHVYTSGKDWSQKINYSAIPLWLRKGNRTPPDQYVRLIYCIAYGEPRLVTNGKPDVAVGGTPDFWNIFGKCARMGGHPEPDDSFVNRIQWKLRTLRTLYKSGVWLLDASVHAIYRRFNQRLAPEAAAILHRQWWENYGQWLLGTLDDPAVFVIGKTVFEHLSQLPEWNFTNWIYQPRYDSHLNKKGWRELERMLEDLHSEQNHQNPF